MTYEKLLNIALAFRPILCALALLLVICQCCSEKCGAFWPSEIVPHVEPIEIRTYNDEIKDITDKIIERQRKENERIQNNEKQRDDRNKKR